MKLILTQEVTGLGSSGDIVEVKDGYGRNYLLPAGWPSSPTRGAEKQIESIKRGARRPRGPRPRARPRRSQAELERLTVTLPARAGDGGRLFGSVTTADVAAAVTAAGGPGARQAPDRAAQPASRPSATHTVTVRVHPEVIGQLDDRGRRQLSYAATKGA